MLLHIYIDLLDMVKMD